MGTYIKRTWQNGKTKLNQDNMNYIEQGIETASNTATDAVSKADSLRTSVTSLQGSLDAISTKINTVEATVQTKQNQLIAGENITIENNTISATGGSSLDFEDLALYTKYGVFRINGEAYDVDTSGSEIRLSTGATYELSGYLKNGHVFVESANPTEETAYTQLIFNGLYIKSDKPRAIYFNQEKKKVAIKLAAGTDNYIYAGEYDYTPEEAEGVIQAEGNCVITSDVGSYLYINSAKTNEQHAIKASKLILSGAGLIDVYSMHDGFHGGKLLRVDSGSYKVTHAEVDGFEAKYLQIFGGNIEVTSCYGDAISSKEERGLIAGYTATINIGDKSISNIDILETVPEIEGITSISLEDYFGEPIIKESSTKPVGDFPTEQELTAWTDILPNTDGVYATTKLYVYTCGYFDKPIHFEIEKSKYFAENTCISTNSDASIFYTPAAKKLECKANEDALLLVINTADGAAVKSNSSVGLQENGNYIFKAANGYAVNNVNYLFTKGDGVKQLLSDKASVNAARFTVGADHADIAEDAKEDMFEAGSVFVNNTIKLAPNSVAYCDGKLYYAYGQIGAIEVADMNVTDTVKFWKETLNVIQTEKSAVIIKNGKDTPAVTMDAYTKEEADERFALKTEVAELETKLAEKERMLNFLEDKFALELYATYPKATCEVASELKPVVVRGKDGTVDNPIWVEKQESDQSIAFKTVAYDKDGFGYSPSGDNAQINIIIEAAVEDIEASVTPTGNYKKCEVEAIEGSPYTRIKCTKVSGDLDIHVSLVSTIDAALAPSEHTH